MSVWSIASRNVADAMVTRISRGETRGPAPAVESVAWERERRPGTLPTASAHAGCSLSVTAWDRRSPGRIRDSAYGKICSHVGLVGVPVLGELMAPVAGGVVARRSPG